MLFFWHPFVRFARSPLVVFCRRFGTCTRCCGSSVRRSLTMLVRTSYSALYLVANLPLFFVYFCNMQVNLSKDAEQKHWILRRISSELYSLRPKRLSHWSQTRQISSHRWTDSGVNMRKLLTRIKFWRKPLRFSKKDKTKLQARSMQPDNTKLMQKTALRSLNS